MLDALFENEGVVLALLVFSAVLLLFEAGYLLWRAKHGPNARHMRDRLEGLSQRRDTPAARVVIKRNWDDGLTRIGRAVHRTPAAGILGGWMRQADLAWPVPLLLLGCMGAGMLAWTVASTLRLPFLLGAPLVAFAAYLPIGYVQWRRARRMATIERQLPEALDLMTRSVRAGHAFTAALQMAGEELPEPIGQELRTVNDEVNYGISMAQALTHLTERVPLTDVRFFVVAVLIQRESGGNLTEILSNLSGLVRDRHKLIARVRVLSAEGRMSAWILSLLPFALGGLLYLFNPKFIRPLWTDPMGISIMQYTLALMAVGVLLLTRIVRIRV